MTVVCVDSITPDPIADLEYFITDPATVINPTYSLTPADCPNELVYSVTLSDLSALPASITFDNTPGSEQISVSEADYSAAGVYTVAVEVTDPKTGLTNNASSFEVKVTCIKSLDIISGPIADILYWINPNQL